MQPRTAIWGLLCSARAAVASGDVATANAYADAAFGRLYESRLGDEPDGQYLAMDVDTLVSDCRWAAGRVDQSIMFLHAAKTRYDNEVGGRLHEPGRLSPPSWSASPSHCLTYMRGWRTACWPSVKSILAW